MTASSIVQEWRFLRQVGQHVEGAGHCCTLEQPAAYDAAVLEFLRRRGPSAS